MTATTSDSRTAAARRARLAVMDGVLGLVGGSAGSAARARRSLLGRLRRDPVMILSIALVVPVIALETGAARLVAVAASFAFLVAQASLSATRLPARWVPVLRLTLALGFILLANTRIDGTGRWPLTSLQIPIVAFAAALGGRAMYVAIAAILITLIPLVMPGIPDELRQRSIAIATSQAVLAIGARRVVASLGDSAARLRRAQSRDRRHLRQLAAVESVGRLLAVDGPTPGALDRVMGVLEDAFRYRYPSVYLWDGTALQLGAQRNYRFPIQTIPGDRGILGRIVHTRQPAYLPDARSDPEFLAADPDVVSEIGIPLLAGDSLLGVLNVETSGEHRLDQDDLAMLVIVGDRLSAALALGRERQELTERAALLDRLTAFSSALSASLDPITVHAQVAQGARRVVSADMVVVIEHDELRADYRIVATDGGDEGIVGLPIRTGEGVSGRAIAGARTVVEPRLHRPDFPKALADVRLADEVGAMSAPMVTEGHVTGAVTWLREDLDRPFSPQEQEIAALLAGRVAHAVANASLHQQARDAAVTDALTGLPNRRHFDTVLQRDEALRDRTPAEHRRARSLILFDLDHFGAVNKQHGHLIGDRVLRQFADVLRARVRAADLVARFGGEEFVAVLDGAVRDDAVLVAEAIRTAFGKLGVDLPSGERLVTTVSAGCSTLEPWEIDSALLLERADVALAMAKAGGRNQVVAA